LLEQRMSVPAEVLLRVTRLHKRFPVRAALPFGRATAWVHAVSDVSFSVAAGETYSIVGESGCGKSTTARMILLIETPSAGTIEFRSRDITGLQGQALKDYRAAVQAVFQDPWSSLSPRMRVADFIAEPLVVRKQASKAEITERVLRLLADVGIDTASAANFPHEFSGGQRQRVAVARALAVDPRLIVLDEPVSALDVSVRAQIMNMLKDLQEARGMSYLLIAHNLATVRYLSHKVAVMYLGQIVEEARSEELFEAPLHPYTQALISASLAARPEQRQEQIILPGEVPSPVRPPPGCRFHTRCPKAFARCSIEEPQLRELASGHRAACHLY
jgi:oligopeptide/dipeptide ABC transporter ATP-binding protein